jgi:uncharacterized protein YkwD
MMNPFDPISRRHFVVGAWTSAVAGYAGPLAKSSASVQGHEPERAQAIAPEELEQVRNQIVEAHNTMRAEAKLKKVTLNRKLTAAAQAHAEDMAARLEMTHEGHDGSKSAERIKAHGYRYFRTGENIAAGRFSVDRLMKGWMDSPVHKRNILGGFSEIGVGCAVGEDGKRYWCVTFGLPSVH